MIWQRKIKKVETFFCSYNSKRTFAPESWQSGRLRQSWKLLTVTGPGVRIPNSPQTHDQICTKARKLNVYGLFIWVNSTKLLTGVRILVAELFNICTQKVWILLQLIFWGILDDIDKPMLSDQVIKLNSNLGRLPNQN